MQNNVEAPELLAIKYPIVEEILWANEDLAKVDTYRLRTAPLDDTSVLPLAVRDKDGFQEIWIRGTVEQMRTLRNTINQLLRE